MYEETQQHRHQLLSSAVTAATIDYATRMLQSTQFGNYVGKPLMRDYLTRLALRREAALAELDAFCATDDITQS